MVIEKIFSDSEGQEKIYSVLMSEEEMKLYSASKKKSQGNRLSLADQDYLEDIDKEIKANKWGMPVSGGVLGGAFGGAIGGMAGGEKHGGKGMLIGGTLGAAGGAYGMHKANKKYVEPGLKKDKEKYVKSNQSDRAYFRRKREQQKNRDAMIAAGIYAGR